MPRGNQTGEAAALKLGLWRITAIYEGHQVIRYSDFIADRGGLRG